MSDNPAIHVLDLRHLDRPGMIAAFLVVGPRGREDGAVLIETGPGSTYENLLAALAQVGFSPADLCNVLLTHIHLDHAGAAGHLAAEPSFGGRIHVHEFGAPHLIDPSRLMASARRIYGDRMDRLWGSLRPVTPERVVPLRDGDVIESAGMRFTAMDTPGHARHHCCFALDAPHMHGKRICFTGDAAGMIVAQESLMEGAEARSTSPASRPFINLPTPPPEFDLEQWLKSVTRIEHGRFHSLFLTHFGQVRTPDSHLGAVRQALRSHVAFISSRLRSSGLNELDDIESSILDEYKNWVLRQADSAGIEEDIAAIHVSEALLRMNIAGIVRYLGR